MSEAISFGTWLRQKRRALDLTQKAFADQIGCAEITVRRMEADEYKPSKELALVLFENLGIPEPERPPWVQFARGLAECPGDLVSASASRAQKTNLPISLTSFIGREKEQDEIQKLILTNRLVTVAGVGGIGKTRLSIQTSFALLNNFPNGIWWVELASLSDPTLVPQVIITTLGLSEQAGRSPLSIMTDFFQTKRVLLILDNCEHLVQACAHLTESLLHSCPDLHVLATSRETLGVDGETIYLVPSLTIPNPKQVTLEVLLDYEAVQLFLERAHSSRLDFMLTQDNAQAIAQVCHHLDGIPLAIELAAARVKVMNIEEIAMRLDDRFRLLTSGARTALPRHQTLRAMIDWSYDLLPEKEKLLLCRLAVFTGGWSLEFAEQVCSDNKIDSNEMLDMLAKLVDKSLLAVDHNETGTRYRILETVRQYAQEKLLESGEELAIRNRHCEVFLAFVEKAAPEILRADQKKWIIALEDEHDNIHYALNWSIENDDAEGALRFCSGLTIFWERHKHYLEAALACRDALVCVQQKESLKTTIWYASVLASSAFYIAATELIPWSDPSVRMPLQQAQEIYDAVNDYNSPGPVLTYTCLTHSYFDMNDLSSVEKILSDSYEKMSMSGYQWGIALVKRYQAHLSMAKGNPDSALALWQESYELFMQIGDMWAAMEVSRALVWQKVIRGEFEDGVRLLKQNLLFYEDYGDPGGVESSLIDLGIIAREKGQYETARRYFTNAIAVGAEIRNDGWAVDASEHAAYLDYLEGNIDAAREKYEAVLTRIQDIPDDSTYGSFYGRFAQVRLSENAFADARKALTMGLELLQKTNQNIDLYAVYYGLGELARLESNYSKAIENYCASLKAVYSGAIYIELPRILDGIAKTEYLGSKFAKSVRLFGSSEALRQQMDMVIHIVDRPEYDKHIELLKSKMSAAKFESAWAEGAKMSFEEVYQYVIRG